MRVHIAVACVAVHGCACVCVSERALSRIREHMYELISLSSSSPSLLMATSALFHHGEDKCGAVRQENETPPL